MFIYEIYDLRDFEKVDNTWQKLIKTNSVVRLQHIYTLTYLTEQKRT